MTGVPVNKDDSLDNYVRAILEELRAAMAVGIPELGIPILDPLMCLILIYHTSRRVQPLLISLLTTLPLKIWQLLRQKLFIWTQLDFHWNWRLTFLCLEAMLFTVWMDRFSACFLCTEMDLCILN